MRKLILPLALSPLAILAASCGAATAGNNASASAASSEDPASADTSAHTGVTVTEIARFDEPWAMAFIPGSPYALITERAGKLKLWESEGEVRDIAGVPTVDYGGQGGLGDVVLAPDYATSGMIYLSWVEAGDGDTRGAAVGRAKLVMDGEPHLEGLQVIWRQTPKFEGRGHFSHRIAFSPDGRYLFIASGERQKFTPAQNMTMNLGKIVRLLPDGTPAPGNPFASGGPVTEQGGVAAQIWSLGHRNILGLRFDDRGRLWDLEHGPKGGDELNLVKRGQNYGWPIVSNGDNYDGTPIPRHSTRPDFTAPAISWNPVIAPGDFLFYRGTRFARWQGQAIMAGMIYQGLVRVAIDGETAREVERIPLNSRIREIEQAEDGTLYVLTDKSPGLLLRITPKP